MKPTNKHGFVFVPYRNQVPPISIAKVIADTVESSNGMLVLQNEGIEADETFSMEESLFIPGPKHMLDNIIGDMLQKMNEYEAFQSSLKVCCEAWTRQQHSTLWMLPKNIFHVTVTLPNKI